MPLNSSRLAIANALVALLETIQNPNTNQPLFQLAKLGNVYDPKAFTTWCEVTHFQGKGGPAGSGGPSVGWRIDDTFTLKVTSAVGWYEVDSTVAETNMLALQDILLPALRQHFQLPDANNPVNAVQSMYSMLVEQPDKSAVMRFPNGHSFKLWDIYVTASQQYNVSLEQN
jgi:hypothetical protein